MEKNQTFRALILLCILALIGILAYLFFTKSEYDQLIDENLANSFINKYQISAKECLASDADTADILSLTKWLTDANYDNNDLFVMHYTSNGAGQLSLVIGIYDIVTKQLKSELRDYSRTSHITIDTADLATLKSAYEEQIMQCGNTETFARYAFYTIGDMRNYLAYIANKTEYAAYIEFKFSQIDYGAIIGHSIPTVADQFSSIYNLSQDGYLLPICYVLDASKNRIADIQAKDMASLCPTQCSF